MRRFWAAFLMSVASISASVSAQLSDFNPWLWPYTYPSFDLTIDAALDGGGAFAAWRAGWAPIWAAMVDNVPIGPPDAPIIGAPVQRDGYTLQQIIFPFPSGPSIPTLLAIPDTIDPTKPVIIAIHGHEIPERGSVPAHMFDEDYWPELWAQAGYVVWAPSHLWYSQFAPQYAAGHSHHLVWVKALNRLLDGAIPYFPSHTSMVATGLSSGAVSASFQMAYRSDIEAGVFAGSLVGLSYLRENYRMSNQPNQWDVKQVFDYAPIYALIAPRPVQWQMGRQDTFFPKTTPVPSSGDFPGLPRPVSVQDFLGEWLLLERIWENEGGDTELHLHNGAHVYDFNAAKAFVEAL